MKYKCALNRGGKATLQVSVKDTENVIQPYLS